MGIRETLAVGCYFLRFLNVANVATNNIMGRLKNDP
jgi:hypothetical protein